MATNTHTQPHRRSSGHAVPVGLQEVRAPTLRRSFSWTLLGYGLYSACNWLMLTALAKMGSKEMVGQYALGVAVTQPILTIAMLQLRSVQTTDAQRQYRFGHFFGLRLLCLAVSLLVVAGAAFPASLQAGRLHWATVWVICITGVGAALDAVSDVFYGLFQKHERMDRLAISQCIKGPLSLLGLILGLCLTGSVVWAVAGSALASALVVLGYDLPMGRRVLNEGQPPAFDPNRTLFMNSISLQEGSWQPSWNRRALLDLLWVGLPLGVTTWLMALNANVPRFFVKEYLGEGDLGIFAAMTAIINAGRTVIVPLGLAAVPRMSRSYADGRGADFCALLLKVTAVGLALGAVAPLAALVAGKQLLTLLYTPEYARHSGAFLLIMIGGGISYVAGILGYALTAARCFRVQVLWYGLTTAVSALSAWWLIPHQGMRGAALSIVFSSVAQLGIGLVILARLLWKFRTPAPDASRRVASALLSWKRLLPGPTFEELAASRRNNFDFLRFAFAVIVIASHAKMQIGVNILGIKTEDAMARAVTFIGPGHMALSGFFLISGFLIANSWIHSGGIGDFLKKRFLRIYPGFLVCMCLCVFVVGPLGGAHTATYFHDPVTWQFFKPLLLQKEIKLPGVFDNVPQKNIVNSPIWTIRYEILCYLLLGLLGLLGALRRPRAVLALFLITQAVFVVQTMNFPHHWFIQAPYFGDLDGIPWLVTFFLAGTLLYAYRGIIPHSPRLFVLALLLFTVGLKWASSLLLPLPGAYILFFLAFHPAIKLHNFARRGDFSYGLYLYAWPVEQILIQHFGPWFHPGILGRVLMFTIIFILTLPLAALSWFGVEKPFLQLKHARRAEETRAAERAPAPAPSEA